MSGSKHRQMDAQAAVASNITALSCHGAWNWSSQLICLLFVLKDGEQASVIFTQHQCNYSKLQADGSICDLGPGPRILTAQSSSKYRWNINAGTLWQVTVMPGQSRWQGKGMGKMWVTTTTVCQCNTLLHKQPTDTLNKPTSPTYTCILSIIVITTTGLDDRPLPQTSTVFSSPGPLGS